MSKKLNITLPIGQLKKLNELEQAVHDAILAAARTCNAVQVRKNSDGIDVIYVMESDMTIRAFQAELIREPPPHGWFEVARKHNIRPLYGHMAEHFIKSVFPDTWW